MQITTEDLKFEESKKRNEEATQGDKIGYIITSFMLIFGMIVIGSSFFSWREEKQFMDG